jgi:enoyl-CoA hydratase/carnithine racemase
VFAAGADVKEFSGQDHAQLMRDAPRVQSAIDSLARIPKPVIAAVTGYALGGGCELALCADIRIAADDATFGQPEVLLGIMPGAGGTQRLTRLVGPAKAKDIIFTGRFVKAQEALGIGLVDQLVPSADVYDRALGGARKLAHGPAFALRAAKEAIDRGGDADLPTGLAIERQLFAGLFATDDRTIGMRSFIENGPGKATFEGR